LHRLRDLKNSVYDSPTGRYLLIPQSSKLIGTYDSQVPFGQNRLLLVWTRLIVPNGRSIVLERQPTADSQGFTGLEDEVDQHWDRLFMGAVLSTVIGIGAELGSNANGSAIASALRQGSSNSLSQTGQQITQRNLNIQPTLTVRPGFPVRVTINRNRSAMFLDCARDDPAPVWERRAPFGSWLFALRDRNLRPKPLHCLCGDVQGEPPFVGLRVHEIAEAR
jgi:hypothetical protein